MKNIVLFLVFFAVVFSGCTREQIDTEGKHDVVIFFTAESAPPSSLKSTTEANADERAIEEILLFGVDNDGVFWQDFVITQAQLTNAEAGAVVLPQVSRKVKKFLAIANPQPAMSTAIEEAIADETLSAAYLEDLICDFSDYPQSPFVMSGTGTVTGYAAKIDLIRIVARIELIVAEGYDIVINSVTVKTRDKGFVFPKEPFAVPTATMETFGDRAPVANGASAILYVAENNVNIPAELTEFTVKGLLETKPVTYLFSLKQGNNNLAIMRNKNYKVIITPVTHADGGFTIEIPDWEDVKIDDQVIPDPQP